MKVHSHFCATLATAAAVLTFSPAPIALAQSSSRSEGPTIQSFLAPHHAQVATGPSVLRWEPVSPAMLAPPTLFPGQGSPSQKSPAIAVGLSLIVPGTGHMYVGKWGWGALYLVLNALVGGNALYSGEPLGYAAWALTDFWIIYDAYNSARQYNLSRVQVPPTPQSLPEGFADLTGATRLHITLGRFSVGTSATR
jgi:TM2 domain-containing membrane protein YozV